MNEPGWEMQEQCERERWQMTVDALDAARNGGCTEEQIQFLARECGLKEAPHATNH
jgi:hypothetical protein